MSFFVLATQTQLILSARAIGFMDSDVAEPAEVGVDFLFLVTANLLLSEKRGCSLDIARFTRKLGWKLRASQYIQAVVPIASSFILIQPLFELVVPDVENQNMVERTVLILLFMACLPKTVIDGLSCPSVLFNCPAKLVTDPNEIVGSKSDDSARGPE